MDVRFVLSKASPPPSSPSRPRDAGNKRLRLSLKREFFVFLVFRHATPELMLLLPRPTKGDRVLPRSSGLGFYSSVEAEGVSFRRRL